MKTAEHIIETVDKLVRKYHTRDPYELCQLLGIKIHYYDLQKKLKGFFYYQSRQKNIVIDHNVNGILERILVAHELGHAVLHTKIAMMHGFQEMEVFDDRSIEENEANFFAAELLLEDGKVLECLSEHTFFETAKMLYVPAALLDYKFSLLHEKGELVNSMYIRKADFLKEDLHSRCIVGWEIDDTLDTRMVINALKKAFKVAKPLILNSDQGCQFTSTEYIAFLKENHIRQSMDGKSRWADNIMIERWFRSFKYEEGYLTQYANIREARAAIKSYVHTYNFERCHSAINNQTPASYYYPALLIDHAA